MHKKSLEAAIKLKEEDENVNIDRNPEDSILDSESSLDPNSAAVASLVTREDLKSESIASLRAKAQSYSALQVLEGLHGNAAAVARQRAPSVESAHSRELNPGGYDDLADADWPFTKRI